MEGQIKCLKNIPPHLVEEKLIGFSQDFYAEEEKEDYPESLDFIPTNSPLENKEN